MRRGSRHRVVLAVVGIGFALVAVGVMAFLPPPNEMRDLEDDLASAAANVGAGGTVPVADVAPFEWDRVYIFGPYTTLDVVKHGLGFDWAPVSPFESWLWGDTFLPNEGFALIVFVRGERDVTGYQVLSPYKEAGLYVDSDDVVMPRGAATFEVIGGQRGVGWELTPTAE